MKIVLWDFDGTLAFRDGMWSGTLASVAEARCPELSLSAKSFSTYLQSGFPWHSPEIDHGTKTPEQWWLDLQPVFETAYRGVGVEDSKAEQMASEVRYAYVNHRYWTVFDDVVPCLSELKKEGWGHSILSNHVPELPELVESLGLSEHFDNVFTSATIGFEKPNRKMFEYALDEIGHVSQIWMIGDSFAADVEGAESLGIPAILVRRAHELAKYHSLTLDNIPTLLSSR